VLGPENRLATCYFPLSASEPAKYETIVSDASQFYFDLSGKALAMSLALPLRQRHIGACSNKTTNERRGYVS
jgi:hypothetical protein